MWDSQFPTYQLCSRPPTLGFNGTEWHGTFGAKRHTHTKRKEKKNMKEGKYPSIHFLTLIWVQVTEAAVYPEAPSLSLGSSLHSQPAEQCNLPIVFRFAMGGLFPVGHCVKKINSRTTSTGSLWCELHILLLWESPDTFQISVISFFGLLPTAHDHRQVWECRLSGKSTA